VYSADLNARDKVSRRISKMSLNDRTPQFQLAPNQIFRTQTAPVNPKKTSINEYIKEHNTINEEVNIPKTQSHNTLGTLDQKTSSKMTNKVFNESSANSGERNLISNSDNSYNIDTEFCGKSEFIISHQKPREGIV
jgi:hypothetical protein